MVNNYEKDCRAHNSKIMYFLNYELPWCLSHIAQKYFTEFNFGFLRNAECHWIYYVSARRDWFSKLTTWCEICE